MTTLYYPGMVVANAAFAWRVVNGPKAGSFTAVIKRPDGTTHATLSNQPIDASGNALRYDGSLPAGTYRITFTFSNGEVQAVDVIAQTEMEFIWTPDSSAAASSKAALKEIKFGDGYAQRYPAGLNHMTQDWDVQFSSLPGIVARQIRLFFEMQGGYKTFKWRTPDGELLKFICRDWSRSFGDDEIQSVRAKFEYQPM